MCCLGAVVLEAKKLIQRAREAYSLEARMQHLDMAEWCITRAIEERESVSRSQARAQIELPHIQRLVHGPTQGAALGKGTDMPPYLRNKPRVISAHHSLGREPVLLAQFPRRRRHL